MATPPLPATVTEAGLPDGSPPATIGADAMSERDNIVSILRGYFTEADFNRRGGLNPRDTKWNENLDLYWNRFDFSKKAPWQSKAVLPEVPKFVDRFAAAMTEALNAGDFFTVVTPGDAEADLGRAIKRMMEVWLGCCSISPDGHKISFSAVFNELMKLGAIMNLGAVVTWRESKKYGGYVSIDAEDPRRIWLDHTRRGLYRIRRSEVDHHQLMRLARQTDSKGKSLYNIDEIELLTGTMIADMEMENQRRTGTAEMNSSNRKTITLDEYLCTILSSDGKVIGENQLVVIANGMYLIRGPEDNPFWHGMDWVLSCPIVPVPLSPYGRSYMENFGPLARLFNDMTNLIMDATFTSAMKAFAIVPEMLEDPSQADDGLYPNVTFRLDQTSRVQDFFKEIDLGNLPPESIAVWKSLKDELQEAASFNEIGMGQLAPNGRTSASEIVTSEQNSSAMVRDLARNVETRFMEPLLGLVWRTGLQHMKKDDPALIAAAGEEMFQMIYSQRKALAEMPTFFEVRGISTMVARGQKLRALLQMLQLVASNPQLMAAFQAKVDVGKLMDKIFALAEIDVDQLALTPREKAMQAITQQGAQPGMPPGAPPAPGVAGAPAEMQQANVQQTSGNG